MKSPLFTTQDVLAAFPWMSSQILHYRIKRGFLPIRHRSTIRGIPNRFEEAELIHAGVLDIQAGFGALNDVDALHASVTRDWRKEHAARLLKSSDYVPPETQPVDINPFDLPVIAGMYEDYDYRISVQIETRYNQVGGSKDYFVAYMPETLTDPETHTDYDTLTRGIQEWKADTYSDILTLGFISVKKVWESADFRLSLR